MRTIRTTTNAVFVLLVAVAGAACGDSSGSATADGGQTGSGAPDATTGDARSPEGGGAPDAAGGAEGGAGATGDSGPAADTGAGDGAVPTVCTGPARPQLTDAEAAQQTVLAYLAQAGSFAVAGGLTTDNWDPTAGVGDTSTFTPTFTVAATGGTHTTVQAAITAAVAQGGTSRVYVKVEPGTYREVVCVPAGAPPITLYGGGTDPTQTVIAFDNYNGEAADSGAPSNPCAPPGAATFGTAGSATFAALANDFQAANVTFSNDVTAATLGGTSGTQAVALYTLADRVVLDDVHVLGHQDTLYIETPSSNSVVRAYVKNSLVAGDVDFIFGGATMVFDGCQIQSVSDRRAPTTVLSPSTDSRNPFGMLVVNAQFTADANTQAASADLGRAWDRSCVDVPTYVSSCVAAGHYPNGQALVRESMLGAHIAAAPWVASATTKRPYCSVSWACVADGGTCPANRLFEYKNTGPGSAP
ncbi:MAG TPA: pectinesterase family protein [Polyangiaceae bacterium]|nr:pectinesterase family protein [Polyangiaceae bacterium]